jgi:hypothetical protein
MNIVAKIRLSHWFLIIYVIFIVITIFVPTVKLDSAVLTLFSVNSFLYGFYVSPIINYQKSRIDELHKLVRQETNCLFDIALNLKPLKSKQKEVYKKLISDYISYMNAKEYGKAEQAYESIITESLSNGDTAITAKLITNQQNRTMINMWLNTPVYSNEWLIILILFSVTTGLILVMDKPSSIIVSIITAAICSGLTLLIISLLKYSKLTHKKAKTIWTSAINLKKSGYHKIFEV